MSCLSFQNAVFAVALYIFGVGTNSSFADPANAKSEYLQTVAGGFSYDFDTHLYNFFLHVKPRNVPNATPFYLVASFENPQSGAGALLVKGTLEAGRKDIRLETGAVSGMRGRRKYLATVQVYADKADSQLLGIHKQAIMFHYVPNIESYNPKPTKFPPGTTLLSSRPSIH